MGFVGGGILFLGLVAAETVGLVAEQTGAKDFRPVTRAAFALCLADVSGVTVSGIASGVYDLAGLVGGVI